MAFVGVLVTVVVFTEGWTGGRLVLDGPGVSLHLRLAFEHWIGTGRVPYWSSEMWTGTPLWALAPSLPTFDLIPLAALWDADTAVRVATVAAQVVAGWGAYALAASLWGRTPATVVAGLVYALHPLFISHGALFGHETSAWVMAATPWLAWSFRLALREGRPGFVAGAGLIAGFAVLHQAEHAYSLVVMCACMAGVELARRRRVGDGPGVATILRRGAVASAVGLGSIAFWLVPFLTLSRSFVLTPPESARDSLTNGFGGVLGRYPGAWLTRSSGQHAVPTFEQILVDFGTASGLAKGAFYLGWVCLALTMVSLLLLPRHDRDGHLTAILFASATCVWLSSGGVSLVESQLGAGRDIATFAVIGLLMGLLLWSFLGQLRLGRTVVAGLLATALLAAMPYVTPFLALQQWVPFLANLRFPRFYTLAPLGLALGTAFPLVAWDRLVRTRRRWRLARTLSVVAAAAIAGAFLVDIAPYRSYYFLRPPDGSAAYRRAAETLQAVGGQFRVANVSFGDPRPAYELVAVGQKLSVGWPHPIASRQAWRLTGEAFFTPVAYRDRALGLSGTAYTLFETLSPESREVAGVTLVRNPMVRPIVRAYDSVVVVEDEAIAPELAVALAARNVGVVSGGRDVARAVGGAAIATAAGDDACGRRGDDSSSPPRPSSPELANEVAMACSLHSWTGIYTGLRLIGADGAGGVFTAPENGLRGLRVWLDRYAGSTDLVVHEVGRDGALGEQVARAFGQGEGGSRDLVTFTFERPIPDSAGRRYAFSMRCERCAPVDKPNLVVAAAERGPGNLSVDGRLDRNDVAAFSLVYDEMPAASPTTTSVRGATDGRGVWTLETSGQQQSVVVVAEAQFPGWEARLDGRRVPVLLADGAFLGIVVPPGEHRVSLIFKRPPSAWVGQVITIFTLVAVLMVVVVRPRLEGWLSPRTSRPRSTRGATATSSSGDPDGRPRRWWRRSRWRRAGGTSRSG